MVEANIPNLVRPMTNSGRPPHKGVPVTHDYMRDDLTQNLAKGLQYIDKSATSAAQSKLDKYQAFKEWLLANGAVFDDSIEFPAVFEGGLEGLAAKTEIKPYTAYIFIPNSIIISIARVQACPVMNEIIRENLAIFGDTNPEHIHPDREQLLLATFLLHHHC